MSIRARLFFLTLLVLVPTALAGIWAAYVAFEHRRDAERLLLRETSRALALVVDGELRRRESLLRAIATHPSLDEADYATFHERAAATAAETSGWIVVADRQSQLVSTRVPYGVPLPAKPFPPQVDDRRGSVLVSTLQLHADEEPVLSISVPWGGAEGGRLSFVMLPVEIQSVVGQLQLPEGWLATVMDRHGTVLARTVTSQRWVGRTATPDVAARARVQWEGYFDSHTLEGDAATAYMRPSQGYGLSYVVGASPRPFLSVVREATLEVSAVALLLLLLAGAVALWTSRDFLRSVRVLLRSAERLSHGEPVPPEASRTGVVEMDRIGASMALASVEIAQSQQRLQQRVDEAVREAQEAQRRLAQSQKLEAVGQLTGGIAHDFNNVLQTLSAGMHLLTMTQNDATVTRVVEMSRRAIERATRLTGQLLSFSRGAPLAIEAVDLREMLETNRDLLTRALRADIALELDIADDARCVMTDGTQLYVALLNLATNARDAMPLGGRLRIQARRGPPPPQSQGSGDFVWIEVSDTGRGIPPELLPKVFEPFFTTKETGKGTGLGLAQVYAFARQSGGWTDVRSREGEGTTVVLALPAAVAPPAPGAGRSGPQQAQVHSGRVLFVEDDEVAAQVVAEALRRHGFEVVHARDVDAALRQLAQPQAFDIVFSDVVMPGRSGVDLARWIERERPGLPVVLSTGYSEHAREAAHLTVIAKPYELDTLAQLLGERIGRPHGS